MWPSPHRWTINAAAGLIWGPGIANVSGMKTRAQARHIFLRSSVFSAALSCSVSGWALVPTDKPWTETPERFLRTTSDPAQIVAAPELQQAGFRTWSYRDTGHVAFAYRATDSADANLSGAAAQETALAMANRIAPELGVRPENLSGAFVHSLSGWTTVFVNQTYEGLDVQGGFIVFGFTGADLTSVRNELRIGLKLSTVPAVPGSDAIEIAYAAASAWAEDSELKGEAELVIWTGKAGARLSWAVKVSSRSPRAELTLYIDAGSGEILAVDDAVHYAEGEGRVRMLVHPINAASGTEPYTVTHLQVGSTLTDSDGELVSPGSESVTYDGDWARVQDVSGRQLERLDLTMQGPHRVYDLEPTNLTQADPFVHVNVVKAFARQVTPNVGWIDRRLTVNVNINDSCNAFWDGQTINFYQAGGSCNNTGQISSIVYHEFGHGYHQNLTSNVVGSIGEGTGDFLAAAVTGDPTVGRGFSTRGNGIRRIDGNNRFPDDYVGQVHQDGLIWASALWDFRQAMLQKYGEWEGKIHVNRAFVRAVSRGPGLGTAYPSLLEGDDDDGDITNGTPNSCEINAAFEAHGLINSGQINHQQVPGLAHALILHDAPGRFEPDADGAIALVAGVENVSACGQVDAGLLRLWVNKTAEDWVEVAMTPGQGMMQALLPGMELGSTFSYRLEIEVDGQTFKLGDEDSPMVGLVDPGLQDIVTEGFEGGFGEWTHGTIDSDLHDDWAVAAPRGLVFDAFEAHGGERVAGTDLGEDEAFAGTDGAAKPGRSTFLESALISTEGMENVHLELWQHHAVAGTLRILVDGEEVYRHEGSGNTWSGGWRYLALPLGEAARDRTDIVVRFEVLAGANNILGGWALDDLSVSGAMIPPPPPPPPPPEVPEPEMPEPPVNQPTDPLSDSPVAESEPVIAGPFTRNTLGGGCTCARPMVGTVPYASALALLFLGLVGLRRRR